MPERMRLLLRWRRARVRELWIAADLAPDEEVGLERFEAAVRPATRDPEDLVAGLLEHLTRPI